MQNTLLATVGLAIGALMTAPASFADSITLDQNGGYSYGDGGEFTAYTTPDNFLEYYVPQTTINGGFETFCVEMSVYFNPGATYSFTESQTDSEGRALTAGAAFLYYEFAEGNLTGYDYDLADRSTKAGELQSALWYLQGDQVNGNFPAGGAGNPFYDLALSTLGVNDLTAPNDGQYNVAILQLWDGDNATHQNQLVVTPVPDGGTTAGLLGIAVLGIYAAHRRFSPHCA
jgi:hypothetical protein